MGLGVHGSRLPGRVGMLPDMALWTMNWAVGGCESLISYPSQTVTFSYPVIVNVELLGAISFSLHILGKLGCGKTVQLDLLYSKKKTSALGRQKYFHGFINQNLKNQLLSQKGCCT